MSPDQLIQLIRQLNVAQIRAELDKLHKDDPEVYRLIQDFYEEAFRQPK